MQKERWNESKTRSFINSYLSKPALWDSSSTEYTQKNEKLKAYQALMDESGLTLNEVRNKIRIYRTTFMQEKNKEATISNYVPRLSWYHDMKVKFKEGQVKSFAKSPMNIKSEFNKTIKSNKRQQSSPSNIQYEFVEEADVEKNVKTEVPTHIIIEPYDEQEDEDPSNIQQETVDWSKTSQNPDPETKPNNLLSSNELFLQSLKSTLDKLPEEKNMRARIKIQEVLYTIMYEKP